MIPKNRIISKVCAVVPTKNEEKSIPSVIDSIRRVCTSSGVQNVSIFVVDDSTDGTRELARDAGAEVIVGGGRGLGSAMYEGLNAAAAENPEFIIAIDGDGQADVEEIPRFLQPLLEERADLVLGSRFLQKDLVRYKYRFINRFGTIVLAWILSR